MPQHWSSSLSLTGFEKVGYSTEPPKDMVERQSKAVQEMEGQSMVMGIGSLGSNDKLMRIEHRLSVEVTKQSIRTRII